ncbi:MAG: YihY/virulence factor BrkB family protein [Bacteroidales bacterium]|nr:YihY/virulence factor BrkB family protein [Bacteroidales bacterium]
MSHSWKEIRDILFTNKIWELETDMASKAWGRFIHFVKVIRDTVDTFAENRMGFQCVALSYFVTLACIPFVALVFFVSNGLRITDEVTVLLQTIIPDNAELLHIALEKAQNIIHVAQSGPVGLVSALLFIWAIIWLMFQTERVFNNVWGIRKIPRNIFKRFGYYISFLFLGPFIVIIFAYGIALYSNASHFIGWDLGHFAFLTRFIGWLLFYGITAFTLSAMYKFIPSPKVKYRFALQSALFAALAFVGFQYLYLETQMFVSRLNAVYGVIAAIPLFLIWLNFSWQIVMYGAELTYALQHQSNEPEQV